MYFVLLDKFFYVPDEHVEGGQAGILVFLGVKLHCLDKEHGKGDDEGDFNDDVDDFDDDVDDFDDDLDDHDDDVDDHGDDDDPSGLG